MHVGNLSRAQLVVSSAGLSFGPPSRALWSVWLFAGQVSPCGLSSSRKPAWTSYLRIPRGRAWKLKGIVSPRLTRCTASLLLHLLVGAIQPAKRRFKGSFDERSGKVILQRAGCWYGRRDCSWLCKASTPRVLEWSGEKVRTGQPARRWLITLKFRGPGFGPILLLPTNVILENLLTYSSLSFHMSCEN